MSTKRKEMEEDDEKKVGQVLVSPTSPQLMFDMTMLKVYYKYVFPCGLFFRWLSYGDNEYLKRREFTFWNQDKCIRYLSYNSKESFKADLLSRMPEKIDFGGVYNASPAKRDSIKSFAPESKELVFDIDMTDYDEVRSCCAGASICHKCWDLMTCAVMVLDASLRDDFGFSHLLWVFSGRRGVHCWIADERARSLKQEEREAIVSYLSVHMGSRENKQIDVGRGYVLHPTLRRAYDILLPRFEQFILPEQKLLESDESCDQFLSFIDVKEREAFEFNMQDPPELKWEKFKKNINSHIRNKSAKAHPSIRFALAKIVFYFTYPRLDIGVSKHLNHLLKSPFSVHPKTGKVCVPFLAKTCAEFDPFHVPLLHVLVDELNAIVKKDQSHPNSTEAKISPWKRTSIKPYVDILEEFVLDVERDIIAQKKLGEVETIDF